MPLQPYDERFLQYNFLDVACTFASWEKIHPECSKRMGQTSWGEPWESFYQRLYEPLMFMTARGIRVNPTALNNIKKEKAEELQATLKELHLEVGYELNPLSPNQVSEYFYDKLGLQPYTNKKGQATTDDKAMIRLARRGYRAADLIQKCRALNKLSSSYLQRSWDSDGRLRCDWKPRGTRTGRLSSSESIYKTGMNLQNLPPGYKPFLIADQGYLLVEQDKAKAEWVITAYVSGCPVMLAALDSGKDIHALTASKITGVEYDLIKDEDKALGNETDRQKLRERREKEFPLLLKQARILPSSMTLRQTGKKSNHALNYKEGVGVFALENEITETEAAPIVRSYAETYIGLIPWWASVEAQIKSNRIITNLWGLQRKFYGKIDNQLIKAAIAHIPQSTNALLINKAIIDIYELNPQYLELLAQVHDSILWQHPIGKASLNKPFQDAVQTCTNILNRELEVDGRKFTIDTDTKVGLNCGHATNDNPSGMREISPSTTNYHDLYLSLAA